MEQQSSDTNNKSVDYQTILADRWPEIARRAAKRAAGTIIQRERFEQRVEYVNQLLLTAAATLLVTFSVGCSFLIRFNQLIDQYVG